MDVRKLLLLCTMVAACLAEYENITKTTCEGGTMELSCTGGRALKINRVLYGRLDRQTCPSPRVRTVQCAASSAPQKVRELCHGKVACQLPSSSSLFGDPCPGTDKYLQVQYQCLHGCHYYWPCFFDGTGHHTRGPDEPYATCKRLVTKIGTSKSRCFRDAERKVLQGRNCRCKPAEVLSYNFITPASITPAVMISCYRPSDARASGCPTFVESCMKTLEERDQPSLQTAYCNRAQLVKKAAMARCERRLGAADLSACGSTQDMLNSALMIWDSRLLCSGCDVQKCLPDLDRRNETSGCVFQNRIHNAVACVRNQPSPTCAAIADILKAVFDRKYVNFYKACKLERKQKYEKKYKRWGCEAK